MKKLIGYVGWDFAESKPMHGTRRFKVWTTEREACRNPSNRYGAKPVFVEVDENV